MKTASPNCAGVKASLGVCISAKPALSGDEWSKDFMEAGKKRLAGDLVRQTNSGVVTELRRDARELKEVVAEQTLELRLLKKACSGMGSTQNEISCLREA